MLLSSSLTLPGDIQQPQNGLSPINSNNSSNLSGTIESFNNKTSGY